MHKKRKNTKTKRRKLVQIRRKELEKELLVWKKKSYGPGGLEKELNIVLQEIFTLEKQYKTSAKFGLPTNHNLLKLFIRKSKLQKQIAEFPSEKEISIKIKKIQDDIFALTKPVDKKVNKEIVPPRRNPIIPVIHGQVEVIEIEWSNITFGEGYITMTHQGHALDKLYVLNAKKSFNVIKVHYKFRNAPKLSIERRGRQIIRVLNREVLTYYILFFQNSGTLFSDRIFTPIQNFSSYTKDFYKTHVPDLFQPRSFSFLCSCAADNLPIIPVPEVVINTNGIHQIHDSFLFPIFRHLKLYWIWESVEESKATYIFSTGNPNFQPDLQLVYDYLTGKTINKRLTLIHAKELKSKLKLRDRKMHTNFTEWKREINAFVS